MSAPHEPPALPRLDLGTVNRLAFIRLLYLQGIEQARLPEPLSFTSLLTFHDAVELFLVLAADRLGAPLPRRDPNFLDYWQILRRTESFPDGVELSGQPGMDRLNRYRNALKHAGAWPGREAVEDALASTASFFENNTPVAFGVAFAAINMADVVPQESTRGMVTAATAAAAKQDFKEAMGLLAEAYDELLSDKHRPRGFATFGQTISFPMREGDIAKVLRQPHQPRGPMPPNPAPLAQQIVKMTEAIQEMQRGLRIMALGIDFRQFIRFEKLTPHVAWFMDGHKERFTQAGYGPTREEFDYCCQFLVTVALRLAELDVHAARPEWWPGR
jgi:hypothetical protein